MSHTNSYGRDTGVGFRKTENSQIVFLFSCGWSLIFLFVLFLSLCMYVCARVCVCARVHASALEYKPPWRQKRARSLADGISSS